MSKTEARLRALCALCLLQSHVCAGLSLVGSSGPVVASVGEDVVLPCFFQTPKDVSGLTLEWRRPEPGSEVVFVWQSHRELKHVKNSQFKDRTFVFQDELKKGNISLRLTRVRVEDEGSYQCSVPSEWQKTSVKLIILVPGTPALVSVTAVHVWSRAVELQCESGGWFPKPKLHWLNSEGKPLSDEDESVSDEDESVSDEDESVSDEDESVSGPRRLFNISDRLIVDHSGSFTCRVTSNSSSTQNTVTVTDDVFEALGWISPVVVTLAIFVTGFVAFAITLLFLYCSSRHRIIPKDKVQQEEQETTVNGLNDQIRILQNELESSKTENTKLKEENDKVKSEIAETTQLLKSKDDFMERANKNLQKELESAQKTISELKRDKAPEVEETRFYKSKLETSERTNRKLQKENDTLQSELEALKTTNSALEEDNESLKVSEEKLQKKLKRLQNPDGPKPDDPLF